MAIITSIVFILVTGGLLSYLMHLAVDDITTEIARKVAKIERTTK
jgi:hypothetical protein